MVLESLKSYEERLRTFWPDYWTRWEESVLPGMPEGQQCYLSVQLVDAMAQYINNHKTWDDRRTRFKLADRGALHDLEAEINTQLCINWGRLKKDAEGRLAPTYIIELPGGPILGRSPADPGAPILTSNDPVWTLRTWRG